MKTVSVMIRAQAEAFEFTPNTSVISITRKTNDPAVIKGAKEVLFLYFDDNETEFNSDQTAEILEFVKNKTNIVVHCDAGISRSAGVAAALEAMGWAWTKPDGKLWSADGKGMDRYKPNVHVKSMILKAFRDEYGEDLESY